MGVLGDERAVEGASSVVRGFFGGMRDGGDAGRPLCVCCLDGPAVGEDPLFACIACKMLQN